MRGLDASVIRVWFVDQPEPVVIAAAGRFDFEIADGVLRIGESTGAGLGDPIMQTYYPLALVRRIETGCAVDDDGPAPRVMDGSKYLQRFPALASSLP